MRRSPPRLLFGVCILAGGLSTRLGREKSRLKLDGTTMLKRIRSIADEFSTTESVSSRVRVLRKDCVARCGPLGGILTGLSTSKASAVLFLACDMPFVSVVLLKKVVRASHNGERSVFVSLRNRVGFPCLLPRDGVVTVEKQITAGEFSLHALALKLRAKRLKVAARNHELLNINTPQDFERAKQLLSKRADV